MAPNRLSRMINCQKCWPMFADVYNFGLCCSKRKVSAKIIQLCPINNWSTDSQFPILTLYYWWQGDIAISRKRYKICALSQVNHENPN